MTDRELLASYAATGSPQAFAEIVERYGGTVHAACRRALGDEHAAQDAAQAVFLVLVRKARALPRSTLLAGWLFRTAGHVCRDARKLAERRARHEREAAEMRRAAGAATEARGLPAEARARLNAALERLAEPTRSAVILRYLRGRSEPEIGRELGCGQSTVAMRLARGLERLRRELAARGVTVPAAALGGMLAGEAAAAAAPAALLATLKGLAVGASAASASATSLADGAIKAMMMAKVKLAAALFGGVLAIAAGGGVVAAGLSAHKSPGGALVDRLGPGEWCEALGSKLSASAVFPPKPTPPGRTGPGAVMGAWGGGALDTRRDRLIVHGGGGSDYAGNEIYVFDLQALRWSRPWGPVPAAGPYPELQAQYAEGVPASAGTCDGLVYLPVQDLLWRGGGSKWGGNGGGTSASWTFDCKRLAWRRQASSNCLGVSVAADYDPVTGHVFATCDRYEVGEYDPGKDGWTRRGTLPLGEEPTAAIDPEARLFVAVGNGKVGVFNIETGKTSYPATSGDQTVVECRGPGLVYDGQLKRIVGWGGGASLYSLDTTTWTWTEHKPAATNKVTPTGKLTRLLAFSKFQYWPARNAYVVVNSVNDSVYFGRIGPAAK